MTATRFLDDRVTLMAGDCMDVLKTLADNSIDSCCTDPPYHLNFMGKAWDSGDIAFRSELWAEVLRVLKPGAYVLAFASTRGFGRMSVAIEDAGFITHPLIAWVFATGFPKATRIKAEGYDGWRYGGQALKPSIEPIYMGQKPFSEDTGTANILRWSTGGINIDGCRVGTEGGGTHCNNRDENGKCMGHKNAGQSTSGETFHGPDTRGGRWPANIVHDGSDEVVAAFPNAPGQSGAVTGNEPSSSTRNTFALYNQRATAEPRNDSGSAARFFYSAKADADDRLGSRHPTVKPVDLMRWLCRLATPKGGTVLDPFSGTGTTGEAAWREGFSAVLIEREAEYRADIARRMELAKAGQMTRRTQSAKARGRATDHGPLFGLPEAAE